MSLDTLFQNSSGAVGSNSYVEDVLPDVTLPATSNSGLTDSSSTNPFGFFVGNNDIPKYKVQTLWCSAITKNDGTYDFRSSVGLKPTFQIDFARTQKDALCYAFGNVVASYLHETGRSLGRCVVVLNDINDGFIVTGRFQRVNWLIDARSAGSVELVLDGGAGTALTFDANATDVASQNRTKYTSIRHSSTAASDDLHTFQIRNTSAGALRIIGVEVYYTETPVGGPGTTFVNKNKATTAAATSLSVPSQGSSIGGIQSYIKDIAGGYTLQAQGFTNIASIGTGSSGTNLVAVQTGTGGSFPLGSILYGSQGTSAIYLNVTNQSTDTLTVAPTLSFGVSSLLTKFGQYGFSQTISSTNYIQMDGLDSFSFNYYQSGFTNVAFNGATYGYYFVSGASSLLSYEGNFGALEMDFGGSGILHGTFIINGIAAFGVNQSVTSYTTRSVVIDLPRQWHTVQFQPGNSMGISLPIFGFRAYERVPLGISNGLIAYESAQCAFLDRGASLGQSIQNIGAYSRVYADSLNISGAWTRGATLTLPGCVYYGGSGSSLIMNFHYYGNQLSVLGLQNGASFSLTVDGSGVGATLNRTISPGSEGWHQVKLTVLGGTLLISGVEYARSFIEKTWNQSRPIEEFIKNPDSIEFTAIGSSHLLLDQTFSSESRSVASYSSDNGTAINSSSETILNFDDKVIDTHGTVVSGSSWRFVAPKSAQYSIKSSTSIANTFSLAAGNSYYSRPWINGAPYRYIFLTAVQATTAPTPGWSANGTTSVWMNAGDTLNIRFFQDRGSAVDMSTDPSVFYIVIEEVSGGL